MGTAGQARLLDPTEFATGLLTDRDLAQRARRIVAAFAELFPESAIVLYVPETTDQSILWRVRAMSGDVRVDTHLIEQMETFQSVLNSSEPMVYAGTALAREAYRHLDLRRTIASWALLPLVANGNTVAVLEIISFSDELKPEALDRGRELLDIASRGVNSAVLYERERNSQLASISRITQFYDLEKTFNATIEIEELLPLIASKFREILEARAVNLWMVESKETLLLTTRSGEDPTVPLDSVQTAGGLVFNVSETGEPFFIDDANDERLITRNKGGAEGEIFSLMAAHLKDQELCVGVVEVINKMDGTPFTEDDLFMLTTICETASGALHNAGLLQSERKAQVLETLVTISGEITSTLNLDRVLQTIVNGPQSVIPFERSAIALEQDGQLRLRAVSGMRQINYGDPSVVQLRDLMEWLSLAQDDMMVAQRQDGITGAAEDKREPFRRYFEATGIRGFYARLLADDQGRLGLLTYESSNPDFLNAAHTELIKILSGQATVALRNAQLYHQVPFISVLEPVLERKRRFMAMRKQKRVMTEVLAAALLLFLIFVPVPLRVSGDAVVAPAHTALVQPEFDGVVRRVLVHEGDRVQRGTTLAEMDDWEFRRAYAEAEAKYAMAVSEMNRALAGNDGGTAGLQRSNVNYWGAELARIKERIDRAKLKSPIDGIVTTPFVENFTGRKLEAGDKFAEVADTSHATVDIGVEEQDVALLKPGSNAGVKLEGYPTKTFRGTVRVVSPKSEASGDERFFYARVDVPNPEGAVRAGMQGRGKISSGWHSAGYVIFRRPAMWAWGKAWSWFGF
jgi:multidrug resistance efflux pump/transcriptional regulator with GAF, ATPase, and Fis domain